MDERLKKFSFDERSLAALEAAILALMARDVVYHLDDDPRPRFTALKERAGESLLHDVELGNRAYRTKLEPFIQSAEAIVDEAISSMTPLLAVLTLIEIATVNPYGGSKDKETAKLTLDDDARAKTILAFTDVLDLRGHWKGPGEGLVRVIQTALTDAQSSHSNRLEKALKVVGLGLVAIVAGIFAGPVIGGLIGTYFLGLSGAAAVSAGLALLGGGALAAGGFGMVGGSVVIATAFGAAGAGASSLFLGKDGEIAARLAFVKHQGAFASILRLDLMDHQLAQDFLESTDQQLKVYAKRAETGTSDAKTASKVADVIQKAHDWMRELYGDAVRDGKILRDPVAWDPQEDTGTTNMEDEDFRELLASMEKSQEGLANCIWMLENANESFSEVRDEPRLIAVLGLLDKRTKKKLTEGHAFLSIAASEIGLLASNFQDEMARIVTIIENVGQLHEEAERRGRLLKRYERMTLRLNAIIDRLSEERAELRAQLGETRRRMHAAAAKALLTGIMLEAHRVTDVPLLGSGEVSRSSGIEATNRSDVLLHAMVAILMDADDDKVRQELGADASSLPSRSELQKTIAKFGLPLGTPLDAVRRRRAKFLGEIHVDKFEGKHDYVRDALADAADRYQLAYELHCRYLAMSGPEEVGR